MNWRRFLGRVAADAEQQKELEFYLDVTTEEYVARGMDPQTARAAARRKLGNATLIREEIYRMNTVAFAEDVLRAARHTARLIRTRPGFVLTVVLSLALGIGANATIFSVVHGVLIQPLPYPHADELVGIYNRVTISGQVFEDAGLSPGMYAACRDDCQGFEQFGVWTSGAATITGGRCRTVYSRRWGCGPCWAAGSRRKTMRPAARPLRSSATGIGNGGSEATGTFSAAPWSSISCRTRSSA